jgi:hypothetical protein
MKTHLVVITVVETNKKQPAAEKERAASAEESGCKVTSCCSSQAVWRPAVQASRR